MMDRQEQDLPEQDTTPAASADLSFEDQALHDAKAELEAEHLEPQAQPDEQQASAPGQPAAPTELAQGAPKAPPPPVPYERFAEVNAAYRQLADKTAFLEGQISLYQQGVVGRVPDASTSAGQPAPQPGRVEQSPVDQQIASLEEQLVGLAEKYDAGELSLKDFKLAELKVTRQHTTLVSQQAASISAQASPQRAYADELLLEQISANLEAQNPYLRVMPDNMIVVLKTMAEQEAALLGQPYGSGTAETARLRQHIAVLSGQYGPRWLPNVPVQPSAPTATANPLSAQARSRADKLTLASTLPPSPSAMGQNAASTGRLTDADILAMSEEDLMALPAETRRQIMSG
jgi:hypothetical protein